MSVNLVPMFLLLLSIKFHVAAVMGILMRATPKKLRKSQEGCPRDPIILTKFETCWLAMVSTSGFCWARLLFLFSLSLLLLIKLTFFLPPSHRPSLSIQLLFGSPNMFEPKQWEPARLLKVLWSMLHVMNCLHLEIKPQTCFITYMLCRTLLFSSCAHLTLLYSVCSTAWTRCVRWNHHGVTSIYVTS